MARDYRWPVASAGLLILCVTVWLAFKIPNGILTYPDELLTAERAREMLIHGRGSVHYNFRPAFAKPPLQYWLTTLTLPRIGNSTTAVRIWPFAYGLLTAVAVGWLAFLIDPKRPWLIALSVAIFVSCPLFSTEARRALLDTGLTFFAALAIGFAQLARRHPAWWLGVAIACWLGALQKIPFIFLVWLIIVAARLTNSTERPVLRSPWLIGSALLAAALASIWPLIQFVHYDMPLTSAFAGDNLSVLFGESHLGSRPYFEVLDGLLASGWAGGSFALLAAIISLKRRDVPAPVRELSILSLTVIVLAVIFNFRSVRYVLPIVPCLSVVLAFLLHRLLEQPRFRTVTLAFVALFVLAGFVQAEIKMHHRGRDFSNEQRLAQELGKLQREGAQTLLIDSSRLKRELRSNTFYLFHGNLRFPLKRRTVEEFQKDPPRSPVVGVSLARDFPVVQTVYPDAQIQFAIDQFVCWQTAAPPL